MRTEFIEASLALGGAGETGVAAAVGGVARVLPVGRQVAGRPVQHLHHVRGEERGLGQHSAYVWNQDRLEENLLPPT